MSAAPVSPAALGPVSEAVLTFDDNRLAGAVYGRHDQNIAFLERRLGVEATAHGNHLVLRGEPAMVELARSVLERLSARARRGEGVGLGDVDGAIRMASAQGSLFRPDEGGSPPPGLGQISTRKKTVMARSPAQDAYIRALARHELVFAIGPAGTGKTYLAVAHAVSLLERGEVDRLVLSRPAVEAGERLGFLPGDMKEKVDPYLRPLYDALYDLMPADRVERGIASGIIEIAPLAFMRGRTLAHAAIILDEAQNASSMQMKMFLTRLGEDARMTIAGDITQIDLPAGQVSGLVEAVELLSGLDGIAVARFGAADVVRHELVARIVRAYEDGRSEGPS